MIILPTWELREREICRESLIVGDYAISHAMVESEHNSLSRDFPEGCLFNWRTGEPLMASHYYLITYLFLTQGPLQHIINYDSVAFLDEYHMLGAITISPRNAAIGVFDCRNLPAGSDDIESLYKHASFVMMLPELSEGSWYTRLAMECNPRRQTLPMTYRDSVFTPANSYPLIRINLSITYSPDGSNFYSRYCLLIPGISLISRLPCEAGTSEEGLCRSRKVLKWEDWGAETRFFRARKHDSYTFIGDGPRCLKYDPTTRTRYILDFRPPDLLLHDLSTAAPDEDIAIVVKPTRVIDKQVFGRPIVTKAPYRRSKTGFTNRTEILSFGVNGAMTFADSIPESPTESEGSESEGSDSSEGPTYR